MGGKNMVPTVKEFLERVMRGRDRRLSVSLLSEKGCRMVRDVVTAILSKELLSRSADGAPSQGVILIVNGMGDEVLDKAIKAVERMLEVYDALQEIPFKISVYPGGSDVKITVRLDLGTLDVCFGIPCKDIFKTGTEVTPHDELQTVLDGLRRTREKLEELLQELEKPLAEPLEYIYSRGIIGEVESGEVEE